MRLRSTARKVRRLWRKLPTPAARVLLGTLALGVGVGIYTIYSSQHDKSVDPASYRQVLDLIAEAESKNNYNAYFGNPNNEAVRLTDMSIAQVLSWQASYIAQGSPSDAAGKYQLLSTTLAGLVEQLGISPSATFDAAMQDKLAMALLERRGAVQYVNRQLTREQFAANLAKEWAALPKVTGRNPDRSYYDADGLNKSLVSVDRVLRAIKPIKAAH